MNLQRYFDRIALSQPARSALQPDLDGLRQLTLAHAQAIPFENLSTLMRAPVTLDLESLEAKLVESRRGGYCFEQNALFAAVLEEIGLTVTRLAARVVWGLAEHERWRNPRTHMVLLVQIGEARYLSDVGFGGVTPTAPLGLESTGAQRTPHESYRILADAGGYRLQVDLGGTWRDVYSFDLQPQAPADYEMANHYVATHPASHFRTTLVAARAFDGGRYMLRNGRLATYVAGAEKQVRNLGGRAEIERALEDLFGIEVADAHALSSAFANIHETS